MKLVAPKIMSQTAKVYTLSRSAVDAHRRHPPGKVLIKRLHILMEAHVTIYNIHLHFAHLNQTLLKTRMSLSLDSWDHVKNRKPKAFEVRLG